MGRLFTLQSQCSWGDKYSFICDCLRLKDEGSLHRQPGGKGRQGGTSSTAYGTIQGMVGSGTPDAAGIKPDSETPPSILH